MHCLTRLVLSAAIVASGATDLPAAAQGASQGPLPTVTLPPVLVTAQKEPADGQSLPLSVSAIRRDTMDALGIDIVGEAVAFTPNTLFADLTARKVSNPYIRGVGSSPSNPGVTTYVDGVPQLNANSSNIELVGIEQIEFVRGAQSALFGRNAIGGVINVSTARPSMDRWKGGFEAPLGNHGEGGARLVVSGPIGGRAALGVALGASTRNGFTVNDLTGKTVDDRSAFFGRAQFVYMPTQNWEARVIVGAERDRDGDYTLNDLEAVRRSPYHVQRDVAGHTSRDIGTSSLLIRYEGPRYAFSSTTGGVWWKTHDFTDLDYSALPILTRNNEEKDAQYTQEFRLASARRAPVRLSRRVELHWQGGVAFLSQHYTQNAVTSFAPYTLSTSLPIPVEQLSPGAILDDKGVAAYGLATFALPAGLGFSVGARLDREWRSADNRTSYSPVIAPPTRLIGTRAYADVSPQAAATWQPRPSVTLYAALGRGFKAGGFSVWAPAGSESYAEEHAWNFETGVKTAWAGGRVLVNAAHYRIDWTDMQLTVPTPAAPAQFYIANVGNAQSSGFEVEVRATPVAGLQFYGTFGTTDAVFGAGSGSGGVDVSGNSLPLAPDYTASVGTIASAGIGRSLGVFGGVNIAICGAYRYDDLNLAGQSAYSLVNLRGGFRAGRLSVEAWMKNALDTRYVPVAFAYGSLTPSGFMGEPGAPRLFGLTARVGF